MKALQTGCGTRDPKHPEVQPLITLNRTAELRQLHRCLSLSPSLVVLLVTLSLPSHFLLCEEIMVEYKCLWVCVCVCVSEPRRQSPDSVVCCDLSSRRHCATDC